MKHVILPSARDDILREFRYYLVECDAPETGLRFIDAVNAAVSRLSAMPDMGAPVAVKNALLKGLRSWHVTGFEDIRIYYCVHTDVMRVLRVLHVKRDLKRILENETADDDNDS